MKTILLILPLALSMMAVVGGATVSVSGFRREMGISVASAGVQMLGGSVLIFFAVMVAPRLGSMLHPILGASLLICTLAAAALLLVGFPRTLMLRIGLPKHLPAAFSPTDAERWYAGGVVGLRVLGIYCAVCSVVALFTVLPTVVG